MRLVDADDLERKSVWLGRNGIELKAVTVAAIRMAPTIEAAPVVHGRWLKASHPMNAQCDQCGKFAANFAKEHLPYCPYCGTKMDGGD